MHQKKDNETIKGAKKRKNFVPRKLGKKTLQERLKGLTSKKNLLRVKEEEEDLKKKDKVVAKEIVKTPIVIDLSSDSSDSELEIIEKKKVTTITMYESDDENEPEIITIDDSDSDA